MSIRAQRILEELIYDRVRSNVNLCQLVVIEQELDDSIQRALTEPNKAEEPTDTEPADAGPSSSLAEACLERAWRRLERDWQQLRTELGCAVSDGDIAHSTVTYAKTADGSTECTAKRA